MNTWVEFYERRDGLPQPAHVRRQGHLDRVLVADVEGDGQRQRPDQVPDQRAGGREEEVADRRVPRVLPRPRRAAHRARDRRHHRDGDGAPGSRASSSSPCPTTYYDELQERVGQDRRAARRARRARHPGRPRRRRLPAPDLHQAGARTGRRCSTRSSSARAPRASARATSRRCSRRSSGSRRCGGICRAEDGQRKSEAPCWQSPDRCTTPTGSRRVTCQSTTRSARSRASGTSPSGSRTAGLYAEELMGHEGFTGTSSLLYHTHPPTTVKSARRLRETQVRGRPGPDAPAPALPHLAGEEGRQPDARPHSAPVQPGHRDALRRARRERRPLLPQRAGRRAGLRRRRGAGTLEIGVRRSAVSRRATTSSSTAASCTAGGSTCGGADQAADHGEPRARALAQALPQRVRPADRGRALQRARHPPAAASSRPTTRRATSRSW